MLPNEVFALACRERYAEDGLVVDESNGEFAHCPLPEGLGETGYYLLHDDHQWQGLLQSKDVGRRCYFTSNVKRWLMKANFVTGYFDLWDIYDEFNQLSEEHKRKVGEAQIGERNTNFGKRGRYNHLSKPIIVTKPCGGEIRYGGVAEAKRELGANQNIFKFIKTSKIVTRGKFKGWQFRYA